MNPTLQMNSTTLSSQLDAMPPNVLTPSPSLHSERMNQASSSNAANPYHRHPPPSFLTPNTVTTTVDTPMKEGGEGALPPPEPNAAQALEYKLHATAASFRQSRDTAHRHHQMAQERLRVVQEEVQASQRSVQSMQQHLQSLQETYAKDQKAHVDLQSEVQRLTNEVRFQHAELIGKRNQFQELQTRQGSTDRDQLLDQLRQKLHQRSRGKQVVLGRSDALPPSALVDLVQPYLERGSEEAIRRWTRCVQQATPKEDATMTDAAELQKWQRRAQGYRDFLALQAPPPSLEVAGPDDAMGIDPTAEASE